MPETGSDPGSSEALMPTCQPWETSGQALTSVLLMRNAWLLLEVQVFLPGFGALTYKCLSPLSVTLTGAVARTYHRHTAY